MQLSLIVLTRSPDLYTTRRLVEAARDRGLGAHTAYSGSTPEQGLEALSALEKAKGEVQIVLGRIGSRETRSELRLLSSFIARGLFSPASPMALERAMDKLETHRRLSALNLPSIPCAPFSRASEALPLGRELSAGPWIIKPRYGSQGRDVFLAKDEGALKRYAHEVLKGNPEALVQPYVAMDKPRDCRVLIIGGRAQAACWRVAPDGDHRSNIHAGGEAFPAKLGSGERQLAERAAAALDLDHAGVDLIPTVDLPWSPDQETTSASGYAVLEVNGSPGLEAIEAVTGAKLAEPLIDETLKSYERWLGGAPHLTSS